MSNHNFYRRLVELVQTRLFAPFRPREVSPIEGRPDVVSSSAHVLGVMHSPPPPLRILVVDDNGLFRRVTVAMLRSLMYEEHQIMHAANGEQGQVLLGQTEKYGPVDVVLLDLFMPRMDGYQFCEWIIHEFKERKVMRPHIIVLSGNENTNALMHLASLAGGVDSHSQCTYRKGSGKGCKLIRFAS